MVWLFLATIVFLAIYAGSYFMLVDRSREHFSTHKYVVYPITTSRLPYYVYWPMHAIDRIWLRPAYWSGVIDPLMEDPSGR
jgi:hypothetical protein